MDKFCFWATVFALVFMFATQLGGHFALEYTARSFRSPGECDIATCVKGIPSRVDDITEAANQSPRQNLSSYVTPSDNKTVVLVQQCYVSCFTKFYQPDRNQTGYYILNTATLPCSENAKVFLCIASCLFHINSHLPGYTPMYGDFDTYEEIYNPQKEIIFQQKLREGQLFFLGFQARINNQSAAEFQSKKDQLEQEIQFLEILAAANSTECVHYCNISKYGICATAFEGNVDSDECEQNCSLDLCAEMCAVGKNISLEVLSSQGQTPPLAPSQPPVVYYDRDPSQQRESPSLYYDLSAAIGHGRSGPLAVVWAVQGDEGTSYFAQTYRHPHVVPAKQTHKEDVYRLFTHFNHSGVRGYLHITEFCHSARVSFALVNEHGISGYSPSVQVCFPGDFYPSPPTNMTLSASYDEGVLSISIGLNASIDHSSVLFYQLEVFYAEVQTNSKCDSASKSASAFFRKPLNSTDLPTVVLRGREVFNQSLLWNCSLVFNLSALPQAPHPYPGKISTFTYFMEEPHLQSPVVELILDYSFNELTGVLNLTVGEDLVTTDWRGSTGYFVNCTTVNITMGNEIVDSKQMIRGGSVVFYNLKPLNNGLYSIMVKRCCCVIENTRYGSVFVDHTGLLAKATPSSLSNISAVVESMNGSFAGIVLQWSSSAQPYGISSFHVIVQHGSGTIVNDVSIAVNGTVHPLQRITERIMFSAGQATLFSISVYAQSVWGTRSDSLSTTLRLARPTTVPFTIPSYVWVIVAAAVVVIAVALCAVIITGYVWYYKKNNFVVIPQSAAQLFVENDIFDADLEQDGYPMSIMDSWEIAPQCIIVLGQLGEGNFGEVFRGMIRSGLSTPSALQDDFTQNGIVVAVKLLKSDATAALKCEFFKEIDMMKKISAGSCPYIVNMIGCSTHEEPIALVLEYAPNGDLLKFLRAIRKITTDDQFEHRCTNSNHYVNGPKGIAQQGGQDRPEAGEDGDSPTAEEFPKTEDKDAFTWGDSAKLGNLTPANLISFGWQIASGMEYLSDLTIVHRDLAARNVLVGDNKQLKISDFGLAREDECYVKTTEGKLPLRWMSAESIQDRVFTGKTDVWSFGVVLWEIATMGGHPYPSLGNRAILPYLLRGMRLEKPKNCSDQWYQLMSLCWALSPEDRPHFTELKIKLEEMLNNTQRDHYIDLTVDEDMPYYQMQPADVEADESGEAMESFLVGSKAHPGYPQPSDYLEPLETAVHVETTLDTKEHSEASVFSDTPNELEQGDGTGNLNGDGDAKKNEDLILLV